MIPNHGTYCHAFQSAIRMRFFPLSMNVINICTNIVVDVSKRVHVVRIDEYFVYPLIYHTFGAKIQFYQFPLKT
jgi:hypothetical protein